MSYTEFRVVEEPILGWLRSLGWEYVSPEKLGRDVDDPFDTRTLSTAIEKLNQGTINSEEDAEKVIDLLRRISNDVVQGNREFFEWLKGEHGVVLKQGTKAETIRLVDFEVPENNTWVITNQFKFSGYDNVRFDIVLMVNGIPLAMIEAKVPTKEFLDYHEAIKQISRYFEQAPQFLKYLGFVCTTDGMSFRYDWNTEDKFFEWKGKELSDPLENSVKALFRKEFFLDFISNFIIFEKDREQVRKKVAMYQQVRAANLIVQRVLERKPKTGLIWHTQGSGKSLTMLFAAWKLKKLPELENPTILMIVDRIDLENQLWGTFSNVDLPYTVKALSAKELVQKLQKDSREVIITTIQKYRDIKDALSNRSNIIIFVDEAHRTQYGKLALSMRKAFPNAFIFGFTGTPIEKGVLGKSTFRAFCPPGELYLDKYGIKTSIEDGSTVRLLYQPRLARYQIDKELLDKEFMQIAKGLPDEDQDKVLVKSVRLRTALKANDRIDKVAKDIAVHFRSQIEPEGFKAQLVAVDREACALYKEALDKYLPPEYSAPIYTSSQNDKELLRRHQMDKAEQLRIARQAFQKPGENPKILIVTDMLLTGFDAPIEQVMYLDKPLRDHKLLQAIARTNRPYHGKEAGIIVDYLGIFKNLVSALNFEHEDIEGVAYDYDLLRQEFSRILADILKLFSSVKRDGSRASLMSCIAILDHQETLQEFKSKLGHLRRLYETLMPDPVVFESIKDYELVISVNIAYNKFVTRDEPDLSDYEAKTRALIMEKLIVKELDTKIKTFSVDKDYLSKLERERLSEDEKVAELKRALQHQISINSGDPAYEGLGERLQKVLKTHEKRQLLEELESLVGAMVQIQAEAQKLGVTKEEYAILNVLRKYVDLDDENTVAFVKGLMNQVSPKIFAGWQRKVKVMNDVEEGVFQTCLARFRDELGMRETFAMSEQIVNLLVRFSSST